MNLSVLRRPTASRTLLWAMAFLLTASAILAITARPAAAASNIAPWSEVNVRTDMTVAGFQGGLTMISASLSEVATLPARVQLMVPSGVEMLWMGEVLGGPVAENPRVNVERTTVDGEFDLITTTLTRARVLQVEFEGPGAIVSSPTSIGAGVTWRTPSLIPTLRLGVVVPSGSTLTTGPPGTQPEVIDATRSIFFQESTDVPAGQDMAFRIVYAAGTGAAPGVPAGQGDGAAYLFPIFVVIFVVAVAGVLLAVTAKRKRDLAREYTEE
ncbi:MAG: hypothetical protein M1617_05365 [Actinobacteria bacterium]|nr:hypothetical protein [Actinomycetota bacterium]MCL5887710.1 hypothetical protein [Actinomycetota bacterium]